MQCNVCMYVYIHIKSHKQTSFTDVFSIRFIEVTPWWVPFLPRSNVHHGGHARLYGARGEQGCILYIYMWNHADRIYIYIYVYKIMYNYIRMHVCIWINEWYLWYIIYIYNIYISYILIYIWYMIYDIWYMIHDIWYMIYDIIYI